MALPENPDAFYADVIRKYTNYVNPQLAKLLSFAGFPVEMRAEGAYIYDQDGRALLDFLGGYGVFSLGHRHPKVVAAVSDQLGKMPLSGKAFFSSVAADLAEKLAQVSPGNLQFTFFCNSGAEAVEGALKFARVATGRSKMVSTHGSFHGKTFGALSVTGREKYRKRFEPLLPDVTFVPFGDGKAATDEIDMNTACMIVEPIQGEGGIQVPPDGYLKELRRACDRAGALLIIDEVQTGLGRTGKLFACEHDGVVPDLMPLAKCLGGGVMPIGAILGTREVWEAVFSDNPLLHTSTFGGGGMACAAGLATLKVIEEEGLVARSATMGALLLNELKKVADGHSDLVSDVRGRGLMVGLEFKLDEVGELVVGQLLKRNVIVAYALNNPRVIRFEPPLIIGEPEIGIVTQALGEALTETSELLATLV
ncbi:MAG: aspartate aminotransferase family protein [Fimbriimonadaceae bacterium]